MIAGNRLSLCVLVSMWLAPGVAGAQGLTQGEIRTTLLLAGENYDLGEYQAAREQVEGLLARAAEAGLDKDRAMARGHLILGAALSKLGEDDEAVAQFVAALELNEAITLKPPFNTAKEADLFLKARNVLHPVVTCDTLLAMAHEVETTASAGVDKTITTMVGNPLDAGDVLLFYKTEDSDDYRELPMTLVSGCNYAATIPAAEVKGDRIEYYVAAKTKGGKMAAARGSVRAPFVIQVEVTAESPQAKVRDEDPDNLLTREADKPRGGTCAGCATGGASGAAGWLLAACAVGLLVGPRRRRPGRRERARGPGGRERGRG